MKRVIALTLTFALALAYLFIPAANADGMPPTTEIAGHNLSLEDRINIVYYVTSSNVPEGTEEGVLIWTSEPELYAYGTEDCKITTSIKSGQYDLYFFNGLAAKQMTEEVKAMSYVKTNDDIVFSDLDTYSIATYCNNKLNSTKVGADGETTLGSVVKEILKYGAASQKYLGYNVDSLAYEGEDYTISSCFINEEGHLIICYSTGDNVDVGKVAGEDGKSAYDIAKTNNGFEGTEAEWLESLKGADGVGIADITMGENGEIVFALTDGSTKQIVLPGNTSPNTDGFVFKPLPDGTYGVKAGTARYLQELVIPASYKGVPVTKILDNGFNGAYVETIVIPDSITEIGENAFSNCVDFIEVTIPDRVTSIGDGAFQYCTSLTEVTIPNSVTFIGNYAFYRCSGLTNVTIGNGVTSIEGSAFQYCTSLTEITIPDSVTSIGDGAFQYCTSLTGITIPDSVTSIGENAFSNCTSLTGITIPDSVTSIGQYAFVGCIGLTEITIPDSVTSIGSAAFGYCTSLTDVTIPTLLLSVNTLNNIFIDYYRPNYDWYIERVTLIGEGETIPQSAFANCTSLTEITVSDSVTSIGENAFSNCTSLTSITIPGSVTSIGYSAFSGCTGLTSVSIPDSVTSIGYGAFQKCTGLTNALISNGMIEDLEFFGCTSLTEITISDSVTSIGVSAFSNCTSLTSITIPDSVTSIGNSAFSNCTSLTSITIPDSVTSIGYGAFQNCTGLTNVLINNCIIGSLEFSGCTSLTELTIPDNVTTIGYGAFKYCSGLTEVTLGQSVEQIIAHAFDGCAFESIALPKTISRIEVGAFWCPAIDFWYDGTISEWMSVSIPSSREGQVLYNAFKPGKTVTIHCLDGNVEAYGVYDGT